MTHRMRATVFLDDGGVMNENARRGPQFARLAARYLAPRFGGPPEAWAKANQEVATELFDRYDAHFSADPYASWSAFWAEYEQDWIRGMFTAVGVEHPAEWFERQRLSRECDAFVTRRVRAAYPGAIDAINRLHRAGLRLFTGSGEASWELDGYLTGMRVRKCFTELYGPDKIDLAKMGPMYYEHIFAHSGVAPAEAIVVDDSERALNWAAEVGASTILCRLQPPTTDGHSHIRRLSELPKLLGLPTANRVSDTEA